ncbi:MAG: hypothetical protein ABW221_13170 [Vicinamibacteria bacterium]
MPQPTRSPEPPEGADALESAIAEAVPGAVVTLTRAADGAWQVRALLPLGQCTRGRDVMSREVSRVVVEVLNDLDVPARVFPNRALGPGGR